MGKRRQLFATSNHLCLEIILSEMIVFSSVAVKNIPSKLSDNELFCQSIKIDQSIKMKEAQFRLGSAFLAA